MASTYRQRWSEPTPEQSRRRTASFLLAVAAHLLVIWLLLRLAPSPFQPSSSGASLKTFNVSERPAAAAAHHTHAVQHPQPHQQQAAARPKPKLYQQSRLHPDQDTADAAAIWALGRGLYQKSDISRVEHAEVARNDAGESAAADAGGGSGAKGSTYGPSLGGPGGHQLFNVQWYREPTEAEMATYIPHNAVPGNWGEVECQTAPRYHVENCRELEQSPPGVGISRALRQAAFQFQVIPPRIDGQPQIGAWVRIRFYITDGGMRAHR